MGCLKLPYYEKRERLNFLGLWKKNDGSKSGEDYYPFGLTFNSYSRENNVPNNYQYNGKENIGDLGLNWDDFGARMYMPEIGRWGVVDPLSEKSRRWSVYNYCYNNPILFRDPDGMFSDFFDKDGNKTKHVEDGSNAQYQIKGEGQFEHYELKEGEAAFDKTQSGKNEVTKESVTSAIQEQQNYNNDNPTLKAVKLADGTNQTYCNFATENVTKTVASATGDKNAVLTGYANTTLNKLEADANPKRDPSQAKNYPSYKSATYAEAAQNAANGGLSVVGKPNGIGHLATFSVGSNIKKGEIANIGTATGTGFKGLNWVIRSTDTKTYYIYTGGK